jgi:hypothetical protein
MGLFDIFKAKESPTPDKIVELAVFSLGSEADLYRMSQHLSVAFGAPAWERFGGRRTLVFTLDEGSLAAQIPYKLSAKLFEDGGGFVRLDLDLSGQAFDVDEGILWRRRELSSALARFLEAALSTRDPEGLKHSEGADESLARLGIVSERIAGELDFGFTPGSTLIKIGVLPKEGEKIISKPDTVLLDGVYHIELEDEEVLGEIERWTYREGASAWHRLSLRRWLERMDDVRSSLNRSHIKDFARFLRRVNRFITRERRFNAFYLPVPYLVVESEFSLLTDDFDPTSRRLTELFSVRQEEAVDAALSELRRLSRKQERLFVAWVVLVAAAGVFLGVLQLFFPQASWLWMIGAGALIIFPVGAYYLWAFLRRRTDSRRNARIVELNRRHAILAESLSRLEKDETVPDEFRDELLTRARRELARIERLRSEEEAQP